MVGLGTYNLYNEECLNIVYEAIIIGYRLIDTAQLYKNHTFIKNAIIKSNICKDEIFIISKINNKNIIKKKIPEAINEIKKELEIDNIDMILLHNPVKNYLDGWKNLVYAQHHFNIKNIGTSNFNENDLEIIKNNFGFYPNFNQIEYNIFNQRPELIEFMFNNNITVQSHTGLLRNFNNSKIKESVEYKKLYEVSNENNENIYDLMHKFILQNNIGIIPMSKNIDHLHQNLNLLNLMENINNRENKNVNLLDDKIFKELNKLNMNISLFRN